jgi:hypothetical protein
MHHLRRSRLPALFAGLVLGFAVLLPEIGHSLAHREDALHAAPHAALDVDDHHHGEAAVAAHGHGAMVATGTHAAGVHPHFDLRPTPPTKTSLALLLAAQTVVEFILDVAEPRPPIPFGQDHLLLAGRNHGPPPPSRAPPVS